MTGHALELGCLSCVRTFAADFIKTNKNLHFFVENAGLLSDGGEPPASHRGTAQDTLILAPHFFWNDRVPTCIVVLSTVQYVDVNTGCVTPSKSVQSVSCSRNILSFTWFSLGTYGIGSPTSCS
jgi:hypothetical protein